MSLEVSSLTDTHAVAAAIAGLVRAGDIVVLAGEMGAGKTAFAQGFGAALGVDEPITSPTFTLVHSYDTGRLPLHHADLYRLDNLSEVADLALLELAEDGVVLVEWATRQPTSLGIISSCSSVSTRAMRTRGTSTSPPWGRRGTRGSPD